MLVSRFLLNLSGVFCLGSLSFPSLAPPPPAEKKLSVNWEAELLNKGMLNPDFAHCVHFSVCYPGVISWLLLTEAHIPSCKARPQNQKGVCKFVLLSSLGQNLWPEKCLSACSLSLMIELVVSGRSILDVRLVVKGQLG